MVPPDSDRISPVPSYSGYHYLPRRFAYRPFTVFGAAFQAASTRFRFGQRGPTTPRQVAPPGFGLGPVRSPLLGTSLLFSSPRGTEMFQFPRFAFLTEYSGNAGVGFPIRIPADQRFFAAPRRFSQLSTSFIATVCLGIHRVPLSTFSCMACTTPGRARPPQSNELDFLPRSNKIGTHVRNK